MRECIVCHQKKIPSTHPDYMKKCGTCYKETKGGATTTNSSNSSSGASFASGASFSSSASSSGGASTFNRGGFGSTAVPTVAVPTDTLDFEPVFPGQSSSGATAFSPTRQCVDCKQYSIPLESQSYVIRCNRCYQLKKYKESGGVLDL